MLFPVCCESAVPGDCLSVRFAMRLRAVRVGMFPCRCTAHAVVTDKRHPRSDRRERDRTNHDRARVAAAPERAPILRTRVGPILGPDSLPHVSLSYLFGVAREFDRESCVSPDRRRATCNVRYIRFVAIAVGCQAWALALRRARGLRPCPHAGGGTQGPRPRLATCALPLGVFYLLTYLEIR